MSDGWKIDLVDIVNVVKQEIEAKCNQKTMALTYAFALVSEDEIDFKAINRMIIDRWSISGLDRIKKMAWKLAEEKSKK